MYKFGTTVETSENDSIKADQNCTAIDKNTGELCGETESLKIFNEFQKLYEDRVARVDHELKGEFERACMKLQIMGEWIKDLGEQNIMLVHTVEDLEQTACSRVKLLEEKLKQSSTIVSANMRRSNHTEEEINKLSKRVSELEHDIGGLLELIRRARQEHHWNMDGITFNIIQPNHIPAPINCTCDEEETNNEKVQTLVFQVEQHQENERKLIEHQTKLKKELADLTSKLATKENTIQNYNSQIHNFGNNMKKHSKLSNKVFDSSLIASDEQEGSNDMEMLNGRKNQQDQIISYLLKTKLLMERERDVLSNCKTELEQVIEKLHLKEKEGYDNSIMNIYEKLHDIEILLKNYKTQVIDYPECTEDLKNCISVIESQVNCLPKMFQNKFVESHRNKNELVINDIIHKLANNVECITKMYSDKEEAIGMINSIMGMISNDCTCTETINVEFQPNMDISEQFKLMETFRGYTTDAQATTEDIKEEINVIVSTSKSQHQRYNELSKKVSDVHDQLILVQERIMDTVTKLQLQDEEKTRHNERIASGKKKLKDIKNKINHAQVQLSCCITDMQKTCRCKGGNMQEQAMSSYTEVCLCNDLLGLVTEEIDKVSNSLLIFQTQDCCTTSMLGELKSQLYCVKSSIKELQKKTDEVLLEQDAGDSVFYERERKLEKLEKDVDTIHVKMQDALDTLLSMSDQVSNNNITKSQMHSQDVLEVLQTNRELYKLKKECDDWKHKALQKSPYAECAEKQWKCQVADLQDQVRILQYETKCNQDENDSLRNSIQSMEKELLSTQTEADNHRRSLSIESMEFKKKIIELENAIRTQKETECTLRQHLNESEIELKNSKKLLNSLHTEYGVEGMYLNCRCNQLRHDTMEIPQVLKKLQHAMQSTKSGLQEFKDELKKLIYEDSSSSCSSTKSVMSLIDQLQKYEEELGCCFQEIEKIRNTLYNKEKLLENRDEIIRIQKNSIVMTQAELKELHQKLQEKIDAQDQIIFRYEKEKGDLLKQNELQIQTIGHLQNAVVEAKRCIDQMEQKAMSDVSEMWPPISPSTYNHGNVHDV